MIKKLLTILAVLAMGGMAFVGCSKDKDDDTDNLAEKIIGKWITAEKNGQPTLTDDKTVITFVSTTEAYISASIRRNPEQDAHWNAKMEADVVISGNKVTLTSHPEEDAIMVDEYTITAIDATGFTANHKMTTTVDGNVVLFVEDVIRYEKVSDYSDAVLGKWECTGLTGIETYNDANARLEFYQDGTYNYWRKNGDQWEAVTNREFQNYFVDGTLLATRWKNQGEEELREWWEIASIAGNEMQWTALRAAEGGTVTQTMTWVKVN